MTPPIVLGLLLLVPHASDATFLDRCASWRAFLDAPAKPEIVADKVRAILRGQDDLAICALGAANAWRARLGNAWVPSLNRKIALPPTGYPLETDMERSLKEQRKKHPDWAAPLVALYFHVQQFRESGMRDPPVAHRETKTIVINGHPQEVVQIRYGPDTPKEERLAQILNALVELAPQDAFTLFLQARVARTPQSQLQKIRQAGDKGIRAVFPEDALFLEIEALRQLHRPTDDAALTAQLKALLKTHGSSHWTQFFLLAHPEFRESP